MFGADADMAQPAQVAQGDAAVVVDEVLADPVVSGASGGSGRAFRRALKATSGVWPARARWGRCWL